MNKPNPNSLWTTPFTQMFNGQTMLFLGIGLVVGYIIAKRWSAPRPLTSVPTAMPQGTPMSGMPSGGRLTGLAQGFENLACDGKPCAACAAKGGCDGGGEIEG